VFQAFYNLVLIIRKENLKKISLLKIISGIAGITLFKKKAPEGAF